jgi:hypothetical protein
MSDLLQNIRLSDLFPFSLFFKIENSEQAYLRLRNALVMIEVPSFFIAASFLYHMITEVRLWAWYLSFALLLAWIVLLCNSALVDLNVDRKCTKPAIRALLKVFMINAIAGALNFVMSLVEPNAGIFSGKVRSYLKLTTYDTIVCLAYDATLLIFVIYLLWRFVKGCEKFTESPSPAGRG